jgi:hypothetical protein
VRILAIVLLRIYLISSRGTGSYPPTPPRTTAIAPRRATTIGSSSSAFAPTWGACLGRSEVHLRLLLTKVGFAHVMPLASTCQAEYEADRCAPTLLCRPTISSLPNESGSGRAERSTGRFAYPLLPSLDRRSDHSRLRASPPWTAHPKRRLPASAQEEKLEKSRIGAPRLAVFRNPRGACWGDLRRDSAIPRFAHVPPRARSRSPARTAAAPTWLAAHPP